MERLDQRIVTQLDIDNIYAYLKALEDRIKYLESLTAELRPN